MDKLEEQILDLLASIIAVADEAKGETPEDRESSLYLIEADIYALRQLIERQKEIT